MARPPEGERRVYVLPTELMTRIREYQTEHHLSSEVEAIRRLLDSALQRRDTIESLLDKVLERSKTERDPRMLSRDVLSAHPLVTNIQFPSEGGLLFTIEGGEQGQLDRKGRAHVGKLDFNDNMKYTPYPAPAASNKVVKRVETSRSFTNDIDDDIPF